MREKQTQREAAMDKEELVFTTIEDLIRYFGECGEDICILRRAAATDAKTSGHPAVLNGRPPETFIPCV